MIRWQEATNLSLEKRLCSIAYLQFFVNVADVPFDNANLHHHTARNSLVVETRTHELYDLHFTCSQWLLSD